MKDLTPTLIGEFQERKLPESIPRLTQFLNIKGKIKVAIGMRRVGKTYLLYQKIQELTLKKKIPLSRIFFINFEDERLTPLTAMQMGQLVDSFYSLFPDNHENTCYLFFDEVQNVPQWSLVLRRLLDTKKVEIFITGSSAKLLSKEIATELRGRSLSTEIWPYCFYEYLSAKKISYPQKIMGPKNRDFYQKHLRLFLNQGGFPEVTLLKKIQTQRLLQDYVNTVIYRDIIERHQVTNLTLLKRLIKTLLNQMASSFSVNKCFNDFKSQSIKVSKNTIHDYMAYLEDAYLVFSIPLFTSSIRKQNSNSRKIYGIDTGLIKANSFSYDENWGALFENLVFLDLKRTGHTLFYYLTNNGYEIDFIAQDSFGKLKAFQVCWNTSEKKTLDREERALKEAQKELNIKGQLITPDTYFSFIDELYKNK